MSIHHQEAEWLAEWLTGRQQLTRAKKTLVYLKHISLSEEEKR